MDIQTFKHFIIPVQSKLYRLAKTMLNDPEEAEDAVQEVLLKLWTRRGMLDNYRSIEALAMIITKNLCLDKLKSNYHQKTMGMDGKEVHADTGTPYHTTELSDSVNMIHRLLGQLPEQQRLVMHLRDIEEYSYEEIEKITGMCVNNIRVTLSRARKSVRENFKKLNNYEAG